MEGGRGAEIVTNFVRHDLFDKLDVFACRGDRGSKVREWLRLASYCSKSTYAVRHFDYTTHKYHSEARLQHDSCVAPGQRDASRSARTQYDQPSRRYIHRKDRALEQLEIVCRHFMSKEQAVLLLPLKHHFHRWPRWELVPSTCRHQGGGKGRETRTSYHIFQFEHGWFGRSTPTHPKIV